MDNQPAFDRSVLIPILLGGFSVIGIMVVLLIGRSRNAPQEIPVTPSATRFQYLYLGTEPAITTPLGEASETPLTEEPVEEPIEETPVFSTPTSSSNSTAIVTTTPGVIILPTSGGQQTNTSFPTSTSASGPPLNPGTYDDVDSHFVYNGWSSSSVPGAYGNTLHVSSAPGSAATISFRFIGNQLRLFYQGGATLGRLSILIDTVNNTLDQSGGDDEWVSSVLTNSTHTVLITHVGGGSVNLDYVIIPEVPTTMTPTATSTPTP